MGIWRRAIIAHAHRGLELDSFDRTYEQADIDCKLQANEHSKQYIVNMLFCKYKSSIQTVQVRGLRNPKCLKLRTLKPHGSNLDF